jgi:hypothetical protein
MNPAIPLTWVESIRRNDSLLAGSGSNSFNHCTASSRRLPAARSAALIVLPVEGLYQHSMPLNSGMQGQSRN